MTFAAWLALAAPARADIPPSGYKECRGLAAGAECEVDGKDGRCVDTRCYSARPRCQGPDCPANDDGGYDCRLCEPGAAAPAGAAGATAAATKSGCGCASGDPSGLVALALAVASIARRARRAVV